MLSRFRILSLSGLLCAAFWCPLPVEAGPPPTASGAEAERKEEKKEEKSDDLQFLQSEREAILGSIAAHGLMTPLELKKHAFSLRSADGAGDLKSPDRDGIDYMSINFAPVGFGGWGIEEVIDEALFSRIGGIFPVTAERSFRMDLPNIESAIGLMEKRMQANVVIILKTDAKADQVAKLTGPMHWGEFVFEGGIPAEDIQFILAPAPLFTLVSSIFKDQPGLTLIPVEDSEILFSGFDIGIALDHIRVPDSSFDRGQQMLERLMSLPGLSGKKLTLPNYQRHLDALFSGPLKDKLFFEYAVRLPILEDVPFLREGPQR